MTGNDTILAELLSVMDRNASVMDRNASVMDRVELLLGMQCFLINGHV